MINNFRGKYSFLSNFYSTRVVYNGIVYTNTEAAFQAQKSLDPDVRMVFANLNASQAKKLGRSIQLRPDWEEVKDQIMYEIVYEKFSQNPDLLEMLLDTGDEYLEEGNTWNDRTWGTVNGVGENRLGKILMSVREELSVSNIGDLVKRLMSWFARYEDEENRFIVPLSGTTPEYVAIKCAITALGVDRVRVICLKADNNLINFCKECGVDFLIFNADHLMSTYFRIVEVFTPTNASDCIKCNKNITINPQSEIYRSILNILGQDHEAYVVNPTTLTEIVSESPYIIDHLSLEMRPFSRLTLTEVSAIGKFMKLDSKYLNCPPIMPFSLQGSNDDLENLDNLIRSDDFDIDVSFLHNPRDPYNDRISFDPELRTCFDFLLDDE